MNYHYFKNGRKLLITEKSHFHQLDDRDLLKTVVETFSPRGEEFLKKEAKFFKPIGFSNIVKTTKDDIIVWIKRKGRKKYSRFVKNKQSEETDIFSFIAEKRNEDYELLTCFKGKISKPELKPASNKKESIDFWKRNAFVYGSEDVEGEVLNENPYYFSTNV